MANINQGYFEPHFLDIAYQVTKVFRKKHTIKSDYPKLLLLLS